MAPRGGIQSLDDKALIFRDSHNASRHFKISGDNSSIFTKNALVPRPKFLFFARFNVSKTGLTVNLPKGRDIPAYANIKDGVVFQIKQIDKPKFNIQTETMHQYNKKRVIQTNIDFNPMTINFHDDVGDRVLHFWSDYYQYYYGDGGRSSPTDWRYDVVDRDFFNGQKDGWGYKGKYVGGAANMHFLDSIELIQFYGRIFTTIKFIRPLITIFDHDNNDYSEGREGTGIRISFDYEGVIYDLDGTTVDGREDEFGFLQDYYDPTEQTAVIENIGDAGRRTNVTPAPPPQLRDRSSTGRDQLQFDSINSELSSATASVIPGGRSFGSASNNNLSKLIFANGTTPSLDLVEKATGVKNIIDNFGVPIIKTVSSILETSSRSSNTGIDSLKVNSAASIINTITSLGEQQVAPGQTKIASSSAVSEFSKSLGTAAALAINEGIVGTVATFVNSITPSSSLDNSIVNKLTDGTFQLTDIGSTIINSMRSPSSALGVRKQLSPIENVNAVDNNKRLLIAENGESMLI